MSTEQQWRKAMQGLALGCLALGVDELPADKAGAEEAFEQAWSTWPHARSFPSVSVHDFYGYVNKSSRRNGVIAAWAWGESLVPYVAIDGWDTAEALDTFVEGEPIPAEEWVALARVFVDSLTAAPAPAEQPPLTNTFRMPSSPSPV